MATSGSVDFQHTRTQLVESALRKCGVLREGVSASANQLTTGSLALNAIVKSCATSGRPLWAIKEGAVFPIHDVSSVSLGPSGGNAATTWVHTQLASAAAAGATTLTVDLTTGMTANDIIGIELDNGNIFWDTVDAIADPSINIDTGLPSAAGVDSHIYTYTSKTVRPLKVIHAQNFNYNGSTESPINIVSRDEYQRISVKTEESDTINQIYYDPQLTRGILHFYPRFKNGGSIIKIWFHRPFEDMDSASDNLDFPQEWETYIIWELAATLAPEMGVPERKMGMLMQKAESERLKVEAFGMEEGSIYFSPERY